MRVKCLAQEHNTMTRPGLEPGPPDPESPALTAPQDTPSPTAPLLYKCTCSYFIIFPLGILLVVPLISTPACTSIFLSHFRHLKVCNLILKLVKDMFTQLHNFTFLSLSG